MAIDTISVEGEASPSSSLHVLLSRALLGVRTWWMKRRTRRALLDLTEEQLRDIGISPSEARREAGKSFYWD